jgi:16S rRNA (cytosine1402-N4)-methyltransferase
MMRSLIAGPLAMDAKQPQHIPVMVDEVLSALSLQSGMVAVDGTTGLGGHTLRFVEAVNPGGTVLGFDWDETMLAFAKNRIGSPAGVTLHLVQRDFKEIVEVLEELGGLRPNGILLDLGLNSAQVDDPSRGLSFSQEGPLDMRMDRSRGEPASSVLNRLSPIQIERMLSDLGDERWAKAIAKTIVERRKASPLRTTADLVQCVLDTIPPRAREKRIHPATRTFQAVRVYVNRELDELDQAIRDCAATLAVGGTLVVLSYHSGEDRIAKTVFRELADEGYVDLYRKPLTAGEQETRRNPRSRSAKLRALRRSGALDLDSGETR